MDRAAEVRRLNEADSHIAIGERNVTQQRLIVDQHRARGQDAREAERLLAMLEQSLEAYQEHRQLIVEMIAQIEAGLA
jgi:hypothetical protein